MYVLFQSSRLLERQQLSEAATGRGPKPVHAKFLATWQHTDQEEGGYSWVKAPRILGQKGAETMDFHLSVPLGPNFRNAHQRTST